jgi:hypothetical protein
MLQINERTIESVAALLYNNIYDLAHPTEGAWCPENRHDDPAYLVFAEALLQAVRNHPEEDDPTIIQEAKRLTTQNSKAHLGWATIVIDQEYENLPEKAEEFLPEIRAFIIHPGMIYRESNFLDLDLDFTPNCCACGKELTVTHIEGTNDTSIGAGPPVHLPNGTIGYTCQECFEDDVAQDADDYMEHVMDRED